MDDQPKKYELKQERLRMRWTSFQDKIFADLVVEQIQHKNRSNNVFDQQAWKHIREQFNAQTGLNFNKKQLRKHLEVLRIRYHNLKSAFDQSGFHLEDASPMVMSDYEIWGDLIEEPPKRETSKIKDCPIFDQLCIIFTESVSDGQYAQSSHYQGLEKTIAGGDSPSTRPRPKLEIINGQKYVGPTSVFRNNVPSPTTLIDRSPSNKRKKSLSETPDIPHFDSKSNEKTIGDIAEALSNMVSTSKLRPVVTRQLDDRFSISKCIMALDEMQGIDQGVYFAALDLFDYSSEREIFMSLQSEERVFWMQNKCGNMASSSDVSIIGR